MNKEKQIEKIARLLGNGCDAPCGNKCPYSNNCLALEHAKRLYEAGYRKQSENTVEVVRCKDCKHLMKDIVTEETPYGFDEDRYVFGCRKFFESSGEWVDVMLDDYCSSGERRCHEPEE